MATDTTERLERETAELRTQVSALTLLVQMLILHVLPEDPAEQRRVADEMIESLAIEGADMPRQAMQIAMKWLQRFQET